MWKEEAISHFMTELIDYAGIFPPAALPLKEAILNYHSYIHQEDSWMLGDCCYWLLIGGVRTF